MIVGLVMLTIGFMFGVLCTFVFMAFAVHRERIKWGDLP